MKNRTVLKCLAVFVCMLGVIFSLPVTASVATEPLEGEDFVKVSQNSHFELYVRPSTTEFMVKNLEDSSEWFSCIQNAQDDPYVGGIHKTEMQSLLSVVYYDSEGVMNTINSYASSVLNGDFVLERLKNGYRVTYSFDDGILKIPLEVTLSKDGLSVDVFTSELKSDEGYSISEISVMPFFASGAEGESGYIFVPDGCGGLISFDEDKTGIEEYSRRIYGADITNNSTQLSEINDRFPLTLPVFGIKRENSAMMCVISEGDSMASVNAYGAKNISAQNNVYASFALYSNMEYTFSSNSVMIFEKNSVKLCDISEKYYFLSRDDADYSGMASKLKELMIESGTLSKKEIEPAPYITLYGGIKTKSSFLGILVDSVIPLTTTGQVKEITDSVKENGIDSSIVNYVSWNLFELKGKSPTAFKINKKLVSGGISFKELMKSEDFTFVPTVSDVFSYTKAGNIFSKFSSPASDIAGTALYKKKLSETTLQEYGERWFFLNKKYIIKNLNKLFGSAAESDSDYVGLSDVSSMLYEDFSKDTMKRYQMKDIVTERLADLSKEKKLVLDNPNYYALGYAQQLINIPMKTSGHLLIDKEVPFLQLVLNGCIRYASQPLNYENQSDIVLKLLETGSMPHVFMYYADESSVKNTEYSYLGSGDYKKNLKLLSNIYSELLEVYSRIDNAGMIMHKAVADDVYAVCYENGAVIYINYSADSFVTPSGNSVATGEYLLEEAMR